MLTININDAELEKRIADKAHLIGKSMEEIVHELLSNALREESKQLNSEFLDPKEYGYYFNRGDDSISENIQE